MKKKLLIIGNARHGKDTVCDMLRDKYDYNFQSSSKFCSERFIFDQLKYKYNYSSEEECFEDRVNHREEWFKLITDYNKDDLARLGREIFSKYDIYCGLRNIHEFKKIKEEGIFDYSVWVDASERLPKESKKSLTITKSAADFVITNNSTLYELQKQVDVLILKMSAIELENTYLKLAEKNSLKIKK